MDKNMQIAEGLDLRMNNVKLPNEWITIRLLSVSKYDAKQYAKDFFAWSYPLWTFRRTYFLLIELTVHQILGCAKYLQERSKSKSRNVLLF